MREDLLKGFTDEQIAKAKACKNQDELLALAKEEGVEPDISLDPSYFYNHQYIVNFYHKFTLYFPICSILCRIN